MATFPPPWESGPGPADPALSKGFGSYTGSGYGPVGQGTVGAGTVQTAPAEYAPAQVRFFTDNSGNLCVLTANNQAYVLGAPQQLPASMASMYSPTK